MYLRGAMVGGQVARVLVDDNNRVKKGNLLLQLDLEPYQVQRNSGASDGAKAVVLLISPAFLASDYIANSEWPVILKNAANQGVRIFPILISPSVYKRAKYKYPDPKTGPQEFTLASLQAANAPSKTLIEMTEGEQHRVLLEVAEQLADLLNP
jgi:multidrug efflux pump subunit AcrA (membrane-fusion protein)